MNYIILLTYNLRRPWYFRETYNDLMDDNEFLDDTFHVMIYIHIYFTKSMWEIGRENKYKLYIIMT
jgi:hypothetical protein